MTNTIGYKLNPKKKEILKKLKKQVKYCDTLTEDYEKKHNEIRRLVIYLKEILKNTPDRKIGDTDILSILSNLEDLPDIDNAQLIANQEDLQRKIEEQEKWKKNVDERIIPSIEGKLGVTINKGTLPSRNNLSGDNENNENNENTGIKKKIKKKFKGLGSKITKKLSNTRKKATDGSKSLGRKITKKLSNAKGRVKKYMNNRKRRKALKASIPSTKRKKGMINTIKGMGSKISKKFSKSKTKAKK